MKAFKEQFEKEKGNDGGFNWSFWYYLAIKHFKFSDKEFWSLTLKKLVELSREEQRIKEETKEESPIM